MKLRTISTEPARLPPSMFGGDLLRHVYRRAADYHPHPGFGSSVMETTSPASSVSTPTTTPSTAIETASNTLQATFLYPTGVLTVNNIDVVQVTYETGWESVDLTVFCEIDREASEFALAKINKSKCDHDLQQGSTTLMRNSQFKPMVPTPSPRSSLKCRFPNYQRGATSC